MIKVAEGIGIVSPYPVFYLEDEGAILASDIHLGIEDKYERDGVHIPRSFLDDTIASIVEPARSVGAKKVVLLGDVKHEFGEPNEAEWYSTKKLLKSLVEVAPDVSVVKGNHDNYIARIMSEMGLRLHSPSLRLGRFLLVHGNAIPRDWGDGEALVMGHEHPAISIKDGFGMNHRYKAFISTIVDGKEVFILPSASQLTIGTDMNATPSGDFLSPIIKGKDLSDAVPYVLDTGVAVQRFPELKHLTA